MSMTREEAIAYFETSLNVRRERGYIPNEYDDAVEALLNALAPVSREQVRRGTIIETIKDGRANRVFSCCGHDFTELTCWFMPDFCPACGAPMTDEAVDILLKRLEVLRND